jgi:MFS family permease
MIYMGRGLADLDPSGVGADYFYRLDGQSSFSVFSKIVDALIPVFGLALSAQLLTVTALVLWLAPMAALAAQFASGRLKWAILICVAAASGAYGGLPLQYAEAFATPRPFAEAGVLAALAALLAGSRPLAVLFLGLAALFHPIMALAGAGAVYVYLCLENRRWIYLGLFGAVGVIVAALLGLPLFSRLLERFDWNWLIVLRLRASFLFPLLWREPAWTTLAVHAVTLAFAPPRPRSGACFGR